MTETEQVDRFCDELDALVARYAHEYDLSYAAVVGALTLKIHTLCAEATDRSDEVATD